MKTKLVEYYTSELMNTKFYIISEVNNKFDINITLHNNKNSSIDKVIKPSSLLSYLEEYFTDKWFSMSDDERTKEMVNIYHIYLKVKTKAEKDLETYMTFRTKLLKSVGDFNIYD